VPRRATLGPPGCGCSIRVWEGKTGGCTGPFSQSYFCLRRGSLPHLRQTVLDPHVVIRALKKLTFATPWMELISLSFSVYDDMSHDERRT
jgi:hypothetical protein